MAANDLLQQLATINASFDAQIVHYGDMENVFIRQVDDVFYLQWGPISLKTCSREQILSADELYISEELKETTELLGKHVDRSNYREIVKITLSTIENGTKIIITPVYAPDPAPKSIHGESLHVKDLLSLIDGFDMHACTRICLPHGHVPRLSKNIEHGTDVMVIISASLDFTESTKGSICKYLKDSSMNQDRPLLYLSHKKFFTITWIKLTAGDGMIRMAIEYGPEYETKPEITESETVIEKLIRELQAVETTSNAHVYSPDLGHYLAHIGHMSHRSVVDEVFLGPFPDPTNDCEHRQDLIQYLQKLDGNPKIIMTKGMKSLGELKEFYCVRSPESTDIVLHLGARPT